ncbi:ABC transporter permease [Roseibium aggregatum]|uniref:ABC transporter permease n=1 Tax=Roseibium aggregatum TaxID=187304 RepID=A0A939EKX2_9HYPH|nr:ABC transporter permease [Roseibium aggregatum]MBN9673629.1 ABC transporter permease [Roseibium aggregatum]
MTFSSIAYANLRSHAVRTLATLFSVLLAVASFVALIGLARGVEQSLLSALNQRQTDVVITEKGAVDLISSIVDEDLAERIEAFDGVSDAAAELTRMTSLDNGGSAVVVAWHPGAYPWRALTLSQGALPDERAGEAAVVGEAFANRYGLEVGDALRLFHTDFEILGIADSESLLTRNLVMLPLATAQRLTFREGQATAINVRLDPALSQAGKTAAIERLKTGFSEYAVEDIQALATGHTFARIADVLSRSIAVVALLSAVFAIFNTMSTAVRERRGEIAIMNAVGWSRQQIVLLILLEAAVLSGAGGLLGCAAGAGVAHAVAGWDAVSGIVDPAISPRLLAEGLLISIFMGLAGALLPALQTTSLSPASVLRGK